MNYNEALDYIHSLLVFGIKPGLERMNQVMEKLSNPQEKLKFIHVAGTNGKGSTCTMIAKAMESTGLKVGLYTSPYVIEFRERIQINGEYISESDLARLTEKIISTKVKLTEFEFITALAFLYFYESGCDMVVLETGLGGRFDATNIIKSPLCCVITRIDYDHTAILGDTITKIAYEKCGIIKSGAKVVCSPNQADEAMVVIKTAAPNVVVPDETCLEIFRDIKPNNKFIYKSQEYTTSLCGRYQISNAITAIEALLAVGIDVAQPCIKKAFFDAFIPARMEVISKSPLVVLDGAHNPNGALALSEVMEDYCGITAIIGMMADKDVDTVLKTVIPLCANVITVKVESNNRTMQALELASMAGEYCGNVVAADSYKDAISMAKSSSGNNPIFVFGSLYLAGEIRPLLKSAF